MQQEFDLPNPPPPPYRPPPSPRDEGARRLSIIAAAIGGGLLLLAGAWSFRSSTNPHDIPTVQADSTPIRVKPENPGGMDMSGGGEETVPGESGRLEPVAETPDVASLHEQMTHPPAAPAPAARAETHAEAPVASQAVPLPPIPPAARKIPAPLHHEAPAHSPKDKAADNPDQKPPHPGAVQVQLTAAASEDAARAEWTRLKKLAPEQFAGHEPVIQTVTHNGKTLYRLRTGGFADTTHAETFCNGIKAKHGACALVNF